MLLDRFLREIGFYPLNEQSRACRVLIGAPLVLLIVEFRHSVRHTRKAALIYAERGQFRPIAAFLEDAVAFVHMGDVVTYLISELDEAATTRSSLFVPDLKRPKRDTPPAP
jgi:hypothetical protein